MKLIREFVRFQSLFYWITYSYDSVSQEMRIPLECFNPYFTGLPILIKCYDLQLHEFLQKGFNPYFTGLPILIIKILIYDYR